MNLIEIILIAVLAAGAAAAIVVIIRRRRSGKSCCGSCERCAFDCKYKGTSKNTGSGQR